MRQFLHALEAQEGTADHHQRHDQRHVPAAAVQPGFQRADRQRRRHQDHLVHQRTLGHRPHHRQFAVGVDAGHLLRVQRQVVAQHAGGLLGGDLGQHRDVVEQGGDIVEQGKQAGTGHGGSSKGNERILTDPAPPAVAGSPRAYRGAGTLAAYSDPAGHGPALPGRQITAAGASLSRSSV
ncbi:hypothetical protein D3C71_1088570 [compost metagenome]